jgi:3-phosphoshikimate 1-carboxyvinyltransferase
MTPDDTRTIKPSWGINAVVEIPPSKSYTNRALIIAALAQGDSTIVNPSTSTDTMLLIDALYQIGISIIPYNKSLYVIGSGGILDTPAQPLYVGNAGTVLRFLSSLATLIHGETTLTADAAMNHRPIDTLLSTLDMMGAHCNSTNGHPPIHIDGGTLMGGTIEIDASLSSQFASGVLMIAPYARTPMHLRLNGIVRSTPYIAMTTHVMQTFGVSVNKIDPRNYRIDAPQHYTGTTFIVEGDASSASYFFAAAAITHGQVRIKNIPAQTLQGDIAFLSLLVEMGCEVNRSEQDIIVRGKKIRGIQTDMNSMPDCVPTLAVVACFANSPTTITNIGHLRFKESDRIAAIATELRKIGARVVVEQDSLKIYPQPLHGAVIETYNDHRIAMSFAIAGLGVDGVSILHPECVSKSFPGFWDEFKKLEM